MSIGDVVLELLSGNYNGHPALGSILGNVEKILDSLSSQDERTQQVIQKWGSRMVTSVLRNEMCKLTLKETGSIGIIFRVWNEYTVFLCKASEQSS
jgi:hypothetical protein